MHWLLTGAGGFCRKADAERTVANAENAAGNAMDAGKVKAQQVSDAAQDYSKQAGNKGADTYGAAKANTVQVRWIFNLVAPSHVFEVLVSLL